MKLIIEINEDDYTMCQILAKEMCDTRLKLTDNLKYAISNGKPLDDVLDKIREEITENIEAYRMSDWETNNILADGLQMALNIIDGYREGANE